MKKVLIAFLKSFVVSFLVSFGVTLLACSTVFAYCISGTATHEFNSNTEYVFEYLVKDDIPNENYQFPFNNKGELSMTVVEVNWSDDTHYSLTRIYGYGSGYSNSDGTLTVRINDDNDDGYTTYITRNYHGSAIVIEKSHRNWFGDVDSSEDSTNNKNYALTERKFFNK